MNPIDIEALVGALIGWGILLAIWIRAAYDGIRHLIDEQRYWNRANRRKTPEPTQESKGISE